MAKEREVEHINLDTDFVASAKRLEELKAGRDLGDLTLGDEYWKALKKHQKAHGKRPHMKENK